MTNALARVRGLKYKTRRNIAAATWMVVCGYTALAFLLYGMFPFAVGIVLPAVSWCLTTFWLIPVGLVLGAVGFFGPFVLILLMGYFIDMAMCKLLDVELHD